jgi:pimeloyl-ACP methyl ester carboxylesterase
MQLEYIINGESNRETILFVHGAGANANQFEKQRQFFSDRYKVVSLSLRGHGGSLLPSPNVTPNYSLDLLADDIIGLIEKLKLDNIHYVGSSAGGVLGYIVCTRLADRFLSLTTFGTTGQMNWPLWTGRVLYAYDKYMMKIFGEKYLYFAVGYVTKIKEVRKNVTKMFLEAADAIPHLRCHLVNYNFLDEIEKLAIPYYLIQCEYDNDINKALKTTFEVMSKNKKSKVVQLKGAGHIANLDKPDEFNHLLLKMITERTIDAER